MKCVLIVEDEESLALTLSDRLVAEGFKIDLAGDGEVGLEKGLEGPYDLILLDVMLPKKNGMDVCRDLRQAGVSIPILMLTARDQVIDKVLGLKLGADDYLTKPFDMLELLARVEALLRRTPALQGSHLESYSFGEISVDFRAAKVERSGVDVDLSALEYKLLCYFIENRGELLTRDHLLNEVWGYDALPFSRTVDQHISSLRKKLETNPSKPHFIVTQHGLGYRFSG